MNTDEFWGLITRARQDEVAADGVAARVVDELAGRDAERIAGFGQHLGRVLAASYKVDLFGAAYLVNGGCSDEGFDAFRGWLMAQGREAFARAVAEPDTLAELPAVRRAALTGEELGSEKMLSVAAEAHRRATGEDRPPESGGAKPNTDDFWDFDNEEEVRRRFPRLAALFTEAPAE